MTGRQRTGRAGPALVPAGGNVSRGRSTRTIPPRNTASRERSVRCRRPTRSTSKLAAAGGAIVRLMPAPGRPPRWRLAWTEDFDELDVNSWQPIDSDRPSNVVVEDGRLEILSRRDCRTAGAATGALRSARAAAGCAGRVLQDPAGARSRRGRRRSPSTSCSTVATGRRSRRAPFTGFRRTPRRSSPSRSSRKWRSVTISCPTTTASTSLPASGSGTSCGSTSTTCTTR